MPNELHHKTREKLYYYCQKNGDTVCWISEVTSYAYEIIRPGTEDYQYPMLLGSSIQCWQFFLELLEILHYKYHETVSNEDVAVVMDWLFDDIAIQLTSQLQSKLVGSKVYFRMNRETFKGAVGITPKELKDTIDLTILEVGAEELIYRIRSGFYH